MRLASPRSHLVGGHAAVDGSNGCLLGCPQFQTMPFAFPGYGPSEQTDMHVGLNRSMAKPIG